MSDRELLEVLLEGRELERLGSRVLTQQGFIDDINEMIGEAKN